MFRQKVILQENFDPGLCLVAQEGTSIVGFIFAPIRKDTGYVNIIVVKKGSSEKRHRHGIVARSGEKA